MGFWGWRLAMRFYPGLISTHKRLELSSSFEGAFCRTAKPVKNGSYQVARSSRCQCMADGHDNEPSSLSFAKKIRVKDMGGDF